MNIDPSLFDKVNLAINPPDVRTRTIANPYWETESRDKIICEFHFPDGRVFQAAINKMSGDDINPDWTDVQLQFTLDEIERNTIAINEENAKRIKEQHELDYHAQEERRRKEVFDRKLEALDHPMVKASRDEETKQLLKQAETLMEVFAYFTILLIPSAPTT